VTGLPPPFWLVNSGADGGEDGDRAGGGGADALDRVGAQRGQ